MELLKDIPSYIAFGEHGEHVCRATRIDHLPHELRAPALKAAAKAIGVERICFGITVSAANQMTAQQIKEDGREILKLAGCDIPLDIFWPS